MFKDLQYAPTGHFTIYDQSPSQLTGLVESFRNKNNCHTAIKRIMTKLTVTIIRFMFLV